MEKSVDVWLKHFPKKKRYPLGDALFVDGDRYLRHAEGKQMTFDECLSEFEYKRVPAFCCHVAGCTQRFTSLSDYEAHYGARHRHVCCECKRSFPGSHLLDIHIEETHDALFQILVDKQSMYCCLVEGCHEKFSDPVKRRKHQIKVHKYPHDFRFNSFSKMKNSSNINAMDTQEMSTESESPSRMPIKYKPKIPKNICFGLGSSRSFTTSTLREANEGDLQREKNVKKKKNKGKGRDWHRLVEKVDMDTAINIENVVFDDMLVTLPSLD